MISISCSVLEAARINPKGLAQQMLSKTGSQGSRGMFTSWQDHIRSIHKRNIDPSVALLNLQQSFLRFADNVANNKKQEKLINHFYPYVDKFNQAGYTYLEAKRRMKWLIVKESKLGGELPYIVKDKAGFAAYYFTEKQFSWKSELRFPLIQRYLSANHLGCEEKDLKVGIYCLEQDEFQFINYNKEDVQLAIDETKEIFYKVIDAYNRG